jgi:hypothetical protein
MHHRYECPIALLEMLDVTPNGRHTANSLNAEDDWRGGR